MTPAEWSTCAEPWALIRHAAEHGAMHRDILRAALAAADACAHFAPGRAATAARDMARRFVEGEEVDRRAALRAHAIASRAIGAAWGARRRAALGSERRTAADARMAATHAAAHVVAMLADDRLMWWPGAGPATPTQRATNAARWACDHVPPVVVADAVRAVLPCPVGVP